MKPNYIMRDENPNCMVCSEIYNSLDKAVLLLCGHTICRECYMARVNSVEKIVLSISSYSDH